MSFDFDIVFLRIKTAKVFTNFHAEVGLGVLNLRLKIRKCARKLFFCVQRIFTF